MVKPYCQQILSHRAMVKWYPLMMKRSFIRDRVTLTTLIPRSTIVLLRTDNLIPNAGIDSTAEPLNR